MQIWGKIVGGTAGFALGGPIAGLLGVIAGHAVDQLVLEGRLSSEMAPAAPRDAKDHPGLREIAFTIGVIALGAKMARVDGDVTQAEVDAFRCFFRVPPSEERNVERFFNLAKRDAAGFEPYARQVAAPGARQPSRQADRPGPAGGGDRRRQPQARADQRRLRPAAPPARAGGGLTMAAQP